MRSSGIAGGGCVGIEGGGDVVTICEGHRGAIDLIAPSGH